MLKKTSPLLGTKQQAKGHTLKGRKEATAAGEPPMNNAFLQVGSLCPTEKVEL